ncbi:hypothetical protein AGMMS49975_02350 [Clostridia bacterium]|nr:hypothetical protein AGMMS49975_02350 [Clostridia bacterium]
MKETKAEFKKKDRTASSNKRIALKIASIVVSVFVLIITFAWLSRADRAARNTVAVARVKVGIPAYSAFTKDNVEKYDLIEKEYSKDEMVLFENVEDEVLGKYSAYYLRKNTVIYKDEVVDEKPSRNEWLYSLGEGEEVVTIPYKYSEAGGDVLLPGDSVRIRVTYESNDSAPEDGNPNDYPSSGKKPLKTVDLFSSIVVMDMINSSGHSVYEVYKEVMRLDAAEREKVMKSKEFLSNIKPQALLLAGDKEDMVRYAQYKAIAGSGNILITILSRGDNEAGLQNLPTLETEVRSWVDGE